MAKLMNNYLQPTTLDGVTYGLDEFTSDFNTRPMIYQVEPERSLDFSIPDINNIVRGEINRYWITFDYLPITRYRQLIKALNKSEFKMTFYDRNTDEMISGLYYAQPYEKFEDYVQYINGKPKLIGIRNISIIIVATNNQEEEFKIEYLPNGGTGAINPQVGSFGDTIQLSYGESFTKSGHRLYNWQDENGINYNLGEYITITQSLILRAIWTMTTTRILSFDYVGASFVDENTQLANDFRPNQEVQYTPPNYTAVGNLPNPTFKIRTGFTEMPIDSVATFIGWWNISFNWQIYGLNHAEWLAEQISQSQSGAIKQYIATTLYTINGNTTIYAHWQPKQFTMEFNSNGGSNILPITTGYSMEFNKPNNPTKSGFTFVGWFYDKDLSNQITIWKMPYSLTGKTTVYAKWVVIE